MQPRIRNTFSGKLPQATTESSAKLNTRKARSSNHILTSGSNPMTQPPRHPHPNPNTQMNVLPLKSFKDVQSERKLLNRNMDFETDQRFSVPRENQRQQETLDLQYPYLTRLKIKRKISDSEPINQPREIEGLYQREEGEDSGVWDLLVGRDETPRNLGKVQGVSENTFGNKVEILDEYHEKKDFGSFGKGNSSQRQVDDISKHADYDNQEISGKIRLREVLNQKSHLVESPDRKLNQPNFKIQNRAYEKESSEQSQESFSKENIRKRTESSSMEDSDILLFDSRIDSVFRESIINDVEIRTRVQKTLLGLDPEINIQNSQISDINSIKFNNTQRKYSLQNN